MKKGAGNMRGPKKGKKMPVWLPEGADYHVGFSNGEFYWGGSVRVLGDLPEILGSSPLFPDWNYDPVNIGQSGYVGTMSFVGSLLTSLPAGGFTMRVEFDTYLHFEMTEATFATDILFSHAPPAPPVTRGGVTFTDQNNQVSANGVAGVRKAAFTLTLVPLSMYASVNNARMVDEVEGGTTFAPAMPAAVTDIILGSGIGIKSFSVWNTPKNEADTQALTF